MDPVHSPASSPARLGEPSLRDLVFEALRYWEARRVAYNLTLGAVIVGWGLVTWPHFRAALTAKALLLLLVYALLANAGYCAAYLIDLPLQASANRAGWRRWRWSLWLAGTLFGCVLTSYWIADEIYPFVG